MIRQDKRLEKLETLKATRAGRILDIGEHVFVIGAPDGRGEMSGSVFSVSGRTPGEDLPFGVRRMEKRLWAEHAGQVDPIEDLFASISKYGRRIGEPEETRRTRIAQRAGETGSP